MVEFRPVSTREPNQSTQKTDNFHYPWKLRAQLVASPKCNLTQDFSEQQRP